MTALGLPYSSVAAAPVPPMPGRHHRGNVKITGAEFDIRMSAVFEGLTAYLRSGVGLDHLRESARTLAKLAGSLPERSSAAHLVAALDSIAD